jgi:hypothetical protein
MMGIRMIEHGKHGIHGREGAQTDIGFPVDLHCSVYSVLSVFNLLSHSAILNSGHASTIGR